MKIGILTLPPYANYGGILQAYALQTILQRQGHDVYVLSLPHRYRHPSIVEIIKRLCKKILGQNIVVFAEKKLRKESKTIFKHLWRFIGENINLYKINDLSNLREQDFDCYVVGSDQIWRPIYFKQLWRSPVENAYLNFTNGWNVRRVSYAASLGVDTWELNNIETKACLSAIRMFDAVSVREYSSVGLFKAHFNIDATFVLDPTMLLSIQDYKRLIEKRKVSFHKNGLLNYILDNNDVKRCIVEKFSKQYKLEPFSVTNTMVPSKSPVEERIMPSVEDWLQGFSDAKFVVTDSFHACVFSILFRKPFVAVSNKSRGSDRFVSLLGQFGLNNHLIESVSDIDLDYDYSIPDTVYLTLKDKVEHSINFINKTIK